MKKLLVLTVLMFNICVYSQKNISYQLGELELEINEYSNTFKIFFSNESKDSDGKFHESPISIYGPYSFGNVCRKNNKIILFDPKLKRYYTFIKIDNYTLKSTKSTSMFKNGVFIKAYALSNYEGAVIRYMTWKNNKRHGDWSYFFDDGISKVKYINGVKVDSVFQPFKDVKKKNGVK